jgi:integrase
VLEIRTSIAQDGTKTWEKDTKTHQQRRIALDEQTMALLRAYYLRCVERAAMLGLKLVADARIFSPAPDGSLWLKPDTIGQRYERMCARLGWDMNLHQLRHYSVTELISAGVDVRTVAGRLGHGGGGTTTLKVYSAWRSEAGQRAAGTLGVRMPAPPVAVDPTASLTVQPCRSTTTPARTNALRLTCAVPLRVAPFGLATRCRRSSISPRGTAFRRVPLIGCSPCYAPTP